SCVDGWREPNHRPRHDRARRIAFATSAGSPESSSANCWRRAGCPASGARRLKSRASYNKHHVQQLLTLPGPGHQNPASSGKAVGGMKSRFAYAAVLVLVALCAAPIGADAGKPVAVAARGTPELALPLGATGAPSTALSLGVAREARALATTEANFPGIPDTGFDPSDGAIAAGPARIVQAVNTTIAFFNRDGTKLGQVALGDFLRLPSSQ